jgi:hypothetical protein
VSRRVRYAEGGVVWQVRCGGQWRKEACSFGQSLTCCAQLEIARTFDMYVRVWVLLDRLEVVLIVILVVWLHNVPVGIESWGIALENIAFVAGVIYALQQFSVCRS